MIKFQLHACFMDESIEKYYLKLNLTCLAKFCNVPKQKPSGTNSIDCRLQSTTECCVFSVKFKVSMLVITFKHIKSETTFYVKAV